ncbi:unnamed protein product [Discosporangium mesarthrocarpum]
MTQFAVDTKPSMSPLLALSALLLLPQTAGFVATPCISLSEQRSLLRRQCVSRKTITTCSVTMDESAPEEEMGGAGFGLPGEWTVEEGGEVAQDTGTPRLPPFEDGRDWEKWAWEWTQNRENKANTLIKQWEEEAAAKEAKKNAQGSKAASSGEGFASPGPRGGRKSEAGKGKGKGKRGFGKVKAKHSGGGEGVPEHLVVREEAVGGGYLNDSEPVDWSRGPKLKESKERDFAAGVEAEATRLRKATGGDGLLRLESNMRRALGETSCPGKTPADKDSAQGREGKATTAGAGVTAEVERGVGAGTEGGEVAGVDDEFLRSFGRSSVRPATEGEVGAGVTDGSEGAVEEEERLKRFGR